MKKTILLSIVMFTFLCLFACEKVNEVSNTAKKIATTVKQESVKMAVHAANTAEQQVDKAVVAVEQQVENANQQLESAINAAVVEVINKIKTWIYEAFIPFFPWIFIVSFLMLFAGLKAAIPLNNLHIIQVPLAFISYILVFWLFSKAGLTSFAIKGSIYIVIPIAITALIIKLGKKSILPKMSSLSEKFASKLTGEAQV